MKKVFLSVALVSILFVTSCGSSSSASVASTTTSTATSSETVSVATSTAESETSSKQSIQDILNDTPIKVDDVDWIIQTGNDDSGQRTVLFSYVNNSKYTITHIGVSCLQKAGLTDEERTAAEKSMKETPNVEYTDDQYQIMGVYGYSNKTCAPGDSDTNIPCQVQINGLNFACWGVDLSDLYGVTEPNHMVIRYLDDKQAEHYVTYDFLGQSYTLK